MKKLALLFACGLSLCAFGKSGNLMRGGFGLLFPDNNSFINPGYFAASKSLAIEANYLKQNGTNLQVATPSVVWGSGRVGLGVYGSRIGTDVMKSELSTDSAGAGAGVALVKDRVLLGGRYERSVDVGQTGSGTASAALTYFGGPKGGFSLGVGAGTTMGLSTNTQNAIAGIGYAFKTGSTLEANISLDDVKDTNDYVATAAATLGSKAFYMGLAYYYRGLEKEHHGAARLGFIIAQTFDFSALVLSPLEKGANLTYGGSLRLAF